MIQFCMQNRYFFTQAGALGCLFAAIEIRASALKNFVAIHRGEDDTFQAKTTDLQRDMLVIQ